MTTRGQPCHGMEKPRPGYQTFPFLSLVVDVTRRSRTCVTSQERKKQSCSERWGGCCRKRQTSSSPRLRGSRLPSRIIQNRAAPYVPYGGNEVAGDRRPGEVNGSDKLTERWCSCLNYERYGLSTYIPSLSWEPLPHQVLLRRGTSTTNERNGKVWYPGRGFSHTVTRLTACGHCEPQCP